LDIWRKTNINHIAVIFSRFCNLFFKRLQSELIGGYICQKIRRKVAR